MATGYEINYDDKRFTEVKNEEKAALSDLEKTYGGMISESDKYYQAQINASKEWANTQKQQQQAQTDFAIEQINQQKGQAKQDYIKEQSGAYTDWQKQADPYGANAEKMAAQGMQNTGYAESSQVSMYNTYQNRVASAREAYTRAVLNYDNAIKDARLQNNATLAEIAYQALQKQLELSLAGFQYKNTLVLEKANKKREIDQMYHNRYQDVLKQINTENALAEEVRQYNESLAEQKRQHNETLAEQKRQHQASLALQREQFEWQKARAAASSSGGSSGGSSSIKKSSKSSGTPGNSGGKKLSTASDIKSSNGSSKKTKSNSSMDAYSAAVKAMESKGVPSAFASNVMTKEEWQYRKQGYSSYPAYLSDYIQYAIETQGK